MENLSRLLARSNGAITFKVDWSHYRGVSLFGKVIFAPDVPSMLLPPVTGLLHATRQTLARIMQLKIPVAPSTWFGFLQ
jgi:hypothetical protein